MKLLHGDCLEKLKELESESVHACVTSPPYWGLRDYGVAGQLGLEKTPEEYVAKMVGVFREVRRVLRDDGTLWLNLGDSYATGAGKARNPGGGESSLGKHLKAKSAIIMGTSPNRMPQEGLKPKDLVGIPWRVAFALQADGWYLRQDIIWHKPNPMPESVRDRCTKAHEYIFLLSKSERYFYDSDAIKESAICGVRGSQFHTGKTGEHQLGRSQKIRPSMPKGSFVAKGEPLPGQLPFRAITEMRNRRSVWTVTTKPFRGAHFATFPPDLIEPCIRAGTSESGACPLCGSPMFRCVELGDVTSRGGGEGRGDSGQCDLGRGIMNAKKMTAREHITVGWEKRCACRLKDPIPCVVLDPFFGAGTTGLVATKLGREYVGIELNADYLDIARKRIFSAFPEHEKQYALAVEEATP